MTDYSKLSDFEINKLVNESINRLNDDGSEYEKFFAAAMTCELENGIFDPCNNPSDAWPIIESFKCAFSSDTAYEPKTGTPWYKCENRLRAAMIVYLMMQEQNND